MITNILRVKNVTVSKMVLSVKSYDSYGEILKFLFGVVADFIASIGVSFLSVEYTFDAENDITSLIVLYNDGSNVDAEFKRNVGIQVNKWIETHQDVIMKEAE